jgi:hypothetical protein
MRRSLAAFVCLITLTVVGVAEDSVARKAFSKLSDLTGDWDGSYQWTGARTDKGSMGARYYLTGNGTSLVEDLVQEGKPTMTSVYHLDGDDLRVTHFCAAGNQPRLRAKQIDSDKGLFVFDFVDATNLTSPAAPHVHGLEIQLVDKDHIELTFLFSSGEKESRERIALARKT